MKQETIDNSLSTLDDPPYCHRLSHAHQLQLIYVPLGMQEISKKNVDFVVVFLTLSSTQCAAVITQVSAIRVPPQGP